MFKDIRFFLWAIFPKVFESSKMEDRHEHRLWLIKSLESDIKYVDACIADVHAKLESLERARGNCEVTIDALLRIDELEAVEHVPDWSVTEEEVKHDLVFPNTPITPPHTDVVFDDSELEKDEGKYSPDSWYLPNPPK